MMEDSHVSSSFEVVYQIDLGDILISMLLVVLIGVTIINHLMKRIWR